jgi:predicted transcriptional regulator
MDKCMNFEPTDLVEKFKKLKEFEQHLKARELRIKQREKELDEREILLKQYRRNILTAVKEHIQAGANYEESLKILSHYKDILHFIAEDIKEDIDDIMI